MKYLIWLILLGAISCSPSNFIIGMASNSSYSRYVNNLKQSGLSNTAMGKEWVELGENVLQNSLDIIVPYRDAGYFTSNRIDAKSYQLTLKEGELLEVLVKSSPRSLNLFLDIFYLKEKSNKTKYEFLAPIDPEKRRLFFRIKEDGDYVIRLQPALLIGGRYEITIRETSDE